MEKVRSLKEDEFQKSLELINYTFRTLRNSKPTMQLEFPLLLNLNNLENMRIIKKGETIASQVNYLKQNILIQGIEVLGASIGAVCTDENFKGRGYSTKVLDDVEKKMKDEKVDFALVSGTRSLYTRRGFTIVNNFYKYTFKDKKNVYLDFTIHNLKEDDIPYIMKFYNLNSTRYFRSYDNFKILLESATMDWDWFKSKKYVVKREGSIIGYILIRINNHTNVGEVIEAYLSKEEMSKSLYYLVDKLKLKELNYYANLKDYKNHLSNYDEKVLSPMEGAIKVINFESFMQKIKKYFIQYTKKRTIDKLQFSYMDGEYFIKLNEEILLIKDINKLHKLIMEGVDSVEDLFLTLPNLRKCLSTVFPIEFIWPRNLNYQ